MYHYKRWDRALCESLRVFSGFKIPMVYAKSQSVSYLASTRTLISLQKTNHYEHNADKTLRSCVFKSLVLCYSRAIAQRLFHPSTMTVTFFCLHSVVLDLPLSVALKTVFFFNGARNARIMQVGRRIQIRKDVRILFVLWFCIFCWTSHNELIIPMCAPRHTVHLICSHIHWKHWSK